MGTTLISLLSLRDSALALAGEPGLLPAKNKASTPRTINVGSAHLFSILDTINQTLTPEIAFMLLYLNLHANASYFSQKLPQNRFIGPFGAFRKRVFIALINFLIYNILT